MQRRPCAPSTPAPAQQQQQPQAADSLPQFLCSRSGSFCTQGPGGSRRRAHSAGTAAVNLHACTAGGTAGQAAWPRPMRVLARTSARRRAASMTSDGMSARASSSSAGRIKSCDGRRRQGRRQGEAAGRVRQACRQASSAHVGAPGGAADPAAAAAPLQHTLG